MDENFKYPYPLIRMTVEQENNFVSGIMFTAEDIQNPLAFHSKFLEFMRVVHKNGLGK